MTGRRRPLPLWRVLRAHPLLSFAALLALCALAFFGLRLAVLLATGGPDAWSDRPVEGWMTPGFVIRVHDVDPAALAALLDADPATLRGKPLSEIAEIRSIPLDVLLAAIEKLRVR